ncbi:cell wall hydrolase [uncultured Sphingomonas sp.]|uniref:cell wall hydrolase n=1 Tax=uncultured Sphingomonas sp. TaxID=158754 RepID=UPI0025F64284|nr:cell wall hydrolase [uncultured Sphingomonas sp.]
MTFRKRAATVAATLISLAGLALHSTASFAAEAPALVAKDQTSKPITPAPVPPVSYFVQQLPTQPAVAQDSAFAPEADEDDVVAYPTLAAAVAAQDAATSDEQLRCLAGAIYFEARGEPLSGQLAVAEVILNRANSGRFAKSACGVVTQPGQFSFVRGGRIPDVAENARWRTAIAVAKVAMKDAWDSDAAKALYFNAGRSPNRGLVRIAAIGNHTFYR